MPRKDFISDKIAGMTGPFAENAKNTRRNTPNTSENKPNTTSENKPEVQPIYMKTPAITNAAVQNSKIDEIERIRRDFLGRLNRDLANTKAQIEIYNQQISRFENFKSQLNNIMRSFEKLPQLNDENIHIVSKEIENLRTEYFIANGHISAYQTQNNFSSSTNTNIENETSNNHFFETLKKSLPLGFFILLASIIIASSILIVFL